ncbi:hypothetical protein ES711_02955 [Gelidibacter salicanalis]|uniref:Uncharacterized protein n=1 Tax=Gelidibacter salicanalis TaxID=291193 RepID=A0A5C7AQI8_9FLAO|nr:hypothetical protein [Gelidibacter salicanalis]TXE10878.1 hypothetical protein ES711_02955 [Gelidibacter salicanalis]
MTLEIIVFIGSILFGILLYWRESTGNGLYRFINKMMYSKKLQMSPDNPRGFVYQQKFLLRLVFITMIFLVGILIARFLIPIDIATISVFASSIVGTLIGTYIGGFVLKSEKVIDAHSDSIEEKFDHAIDQGRDFIQDITSREPKVVEEAKKEIEENPVEPKKSARERLKDKGLM